MTDPSGIIVGAFIGSGVTGLFAIISIQLQRWAEERRQIRELAVQLALENWRHQYEHGKEVAREGKTVIQPPLDVYLIHAMSLVKALDGRVKTPEGIAALLRESFAMSRAAQKEINTRDKQ